MFENKPICRDCAMYFPTTVYVGISSCQQDRPVNCYPTEPPLDSKVKDGQKGLYLWPGMPRDCGARGKNNLTLS